MKQRIRHTLLVNFAGIFFVGLILTGFLWMYSEYVEYRDLSEKIRHDYLDSNKATIKQSVDQAVTRVRFSMTQIEKNLKKNIEGRTLMACAVASSIYTSPDHKGFSREDTVQHVVDALRNMSFNDGRGYFFCFRSEWCNKTAPSLA